jgi:hypothetical protein
VERVRANTHFKGGIGREASNLDRKDLSNGNSSEYYEPEP